MNRKVAEMRKHGMSGLGWLAKSRVLFVVTLLVGFFTLATGAQAATVTLYPASNTVVGTVTSPTNGYANDNAAASVATSASSSLALGGFNNTNLGTISDVTVWVKYKTSAAPSNDTYAFAAAIDGTNFTNSIVAANTTNQAAYTTANLSLGALTWANIGTLAVRGATTKVGASDGYTLDFDVAYIVVTYAAPVCTPAAPTVTIEAPKTITTDNGNVTYTVTVTNNDSAACGSTTFNLARGDSNAAFSSSLSPTALTLAPAASNTTTLTVTEATAASGNTTTTTVTASEASHSNGTNTVVTTYSPAGPNNPLLHNSISTGSSKWPIAESGKTVDGWGITGAKYGEIVCTTCHARNTGNIKRVKTTLTAPDAADQFPVQAASGTVNFQSGTGANSFGDDGRAVLTQSNLICEVCHSKTSAHRYDSSTGVTDFNHKNANQTDCISCHPHKVGFKPSGCDSCHGEPPIVGTPGTGAPTTGLTFNPVTTGSTTAGAHQKHAITLGYVCNNCHNGYVMPNNGDIDVHFSNFGSTTGTYTGQTTAKYNGSTGTGGLTCATVYCHGSTIGGNSAAWNGTIACGACHKFDAATMATSTFGAHDKHAGNGSGQLGLACTKCHPAYAANHVNGTVAWALDTADTKIGATAVYRTLPSGATAARAPSATYGNCTNIYCHSDGKGGYKSPAWSGSLSGCLSCHDGASAATTLSGAHKAHVDSGVTAATIGKTLGCEQCHADTVSNNTTVNNAANHINVVKDVKVAIDATGCTNIKCHSNGNFDGTPVYNNPAWGTTLGCVNCHGNGTISYPSYADGNAGTGASNSHNKHVGTSGLTCEECHAITSKTGTTLDGSDPTQHVDQGVDISFKQGGSINGDETCSSTYCHGTGPSVAWGGTTTCASCHGANNNGDLSVSATVGHAIHYASATAATSLSQADDFTSAYVYGCANCHPTATHARGPASAARVAEMTGAKISVYAEGTAGTDAKGFKFTNGTCTTVCHTRDGASGAPIVTAVWNGAKTSPNCGVCHNKAGDASPLWTTPHTAHINTYSTNTNLTCNSCHNTTAASNTAINNTAAARAQHPNASKNVDFNTFSGGSWSGTQCSNTYCHSPGTAAAGTHANISWSGTMLVDCTSCHGGNSTSATKIVTNAHDAHTNDTANQVGFNVGCVVCHSATVTGDRALQASKALHVNKNVNVRFDNGTLVKDTDLPLYNAADARSTAASGSSKAAGSAVASCAAVYCHSIGNLDATGAVITAGGVNYRTVAWNATIAGCDDCHGDLAGKSYPVYTSGAAGSTTANSHVKHVEGSTLSCDYCHNTTTTDATLPPTTVLNAGQHLDRTEDVSFKSNGGKTGTYNADKTCSATYCHGTAASVAWGGTTNCASCHGASNNGDLSVALTAGHVKHYQSATAPTTMTDADAHTTTAYVYACQSCHPTATHSTGPASALRDAQVTGTKMTGYTEGGASSTDAKGFKYTATGTCNTLCHTKDGVTAGSGIVASPAWNGTNALGCGYCHSKAGDASPTWTTPHTVHINTYSTNTNLTCEVCHTVVAASNSALQATVAARQNHPDQTKDVGFGTFSGGAWSGTQCSNTYCHSPGTAAAGTHANISWSGTMLVDCTSCHGGNSTSATKIVTNAHDAHTNDTANQVGFNVGCVVCHSATVTGDRALQASKALHVNKNVNVRFDNGTLVKDTDLPLYNAADARSTAASGSSKAAGSAVASCAAVYCHSIGNLDATGAVITAGGVNYRTVAWNATIAGCDDCHGDLAGKSYPVYTSGAAGSTTANSHVKHVEGSTLSCDYCHNTTTTDATLPPTTVLNAGQHLDRTEDVSFKSNGGKTGTYNADKTCSATYCHGTAASVAWGGTTNCASCHGASNNGDLSVALTAGHVKHYQSATAPTTMTDADAHTTTAYVYACQSCHPTATHSTGPASALRDAQVTGTKMTGYTEGGASSTDAKGFKYTATGTCNTLCHTKDGVTAGSAIVAAVWNGAKTTPNCGVCHSKAGDASPTWSTLHTKHINTYSANTNFSCNNCHNTVAASNTAINGTVAARQNHPDQTKDVDFNAWTGGTWSGTQCSNTYCHGNGVTAIHAAISWSGTVGCTGCHGGGGATTTTLSTAHLVHVGNGVTDVNKQFNYTCDVCHTTTAASNAALNATTGTAQHVDKIKQVAVLVSKGGTATNSGDYGAVTAGSCATTNCHGTASVAWATGATNGDCSACHGMSDPTKAGRDTAQQTGNTDAQVGAHVAHLTSVKNWTSDIACGECHKTTVDNMAAQATYVNKVNAVGHFDSTSPAELVFGTLANTNSSATNYSGAPGGTCATSYCHDGSKIGHGWSGTLNVPDWNTPFFTGTASHDCAFCHGYPPSPANGHPNDADCSACHTNTVAADNGFTDVTKHINGIVETEGGDNCLDCHGTGKYKDGEASDPDHKSHTSMATVLTGKKLSLSDYGNATYWYSVSYDATGKLLMGCGQCHPADVALHRNNAPNTKLTSTGEAGIPAVNAKRNNSATAAFTSITGKCSGVYCHSDGINDGVYPDTAVWDLTNPNGGMSCASCHGNSPTTNAHNLHAVGIHYDTLYDDDRNGLMPSSAVPATDAGAAHGNSATSDTLGCQTCHNSTMTVEYNAGNTLCATCHSDSNTPVTGNELAVIKVSSSAHLDGAPTVTFASLSGFKSKAQIRDDITTVASLNTSWSRVSGDYKKATGLGYDSGKNVVPGWNSGAKTCSTVDCHNGILTPAWGTVSASGNCSACHASVPQ
ncbi:MAG: CxxxxCH/CxxCH domain-containing protein [Desulfuromonas sp.]|nr:CxxxxCH/CxxCH domain-containing protein [Desulfuromonas sp.]